MSWKEVCLGDVISTKKGFAFKSSKYVPQGIPIVRVSDFTMDSISDDDLRFYPQEEREQYKEFELREKDIIVQTVGSWQNNPASVVGKVVRVPHFLDRALLNQNAVKIIPNKEIDRDYIFYRLRTDEFKGHILGEARGAANQASITLETIKSFRFFLPDHNTQIKIGQILSAYDNLIKNNQKQIKLLEEAAQRLYKEWFVKLRLPNYEKCIIVDGLPEGWKMVHIFDVCETIGGGTPSTKVNEYYQDGEIRWVTPTDITRNKSLILLDSEKKITKLGLKKSSAKMVPPYTILMTSRASIGYFAICEHKVCTNQGIISCIPYEENVRYFLLYNLMNRVEEIRQKASGSTFLEISKKSFGELEIVLPASNVLEMFNRVNILYIKQIETFTKKINKLMQARERLLPKLLNGEIEI